MWIRSPTFLFFAVALCALAVAHSVATTFYLYWTYLWLDIPMHALGGVVVALGVLVVFSAPVRGTFLKGLLVTLTAVLAVGAAWEVFEWMTSITGPEEEYIGDTTLDFLMDIVGGCIGYTIARVGARLNPESS